MGNGPSRKKQTREEQLVAERMEQEIRERIDQQERADASAAGFGGGASSAGDPYAPYSYAGNEGGLGAGSGGGGGGGAAAEFGVGGMPDVLDPSSPDKEEMAQLFEFVELLSSLTILDKQAVLKKLSSMPLSSSKAFLHKLSSMSPLTQLSFLRAEARPFEFAGPSQSAALSFGVSGDMTEDECFSSYRAAVNEKDLKDRRAAEVKREQRRAASEEQALQERIDRANGGSSEDLLGRASFKRDPFGINRSSYPILSNDDIYGKTYSRILDPITQPFFDYIRLADSLSGGFLDRLIAEGVSSDAVYERALKKGARPTERTLGLLFEHGMLGAVPMLNKLKGVGLGSMASLPAMKKGERVSAQRVLTFYEQGFSFDGNPIDFLLEHGNGDVAEAIEVLRKKYNIQPTEKTFGLACNSAYVHNTKAFIEGNSVSVPEDAVDVMCDAVEAGELSGDQFLEIVVSRQLSISSVIFARVSSRVSAECLKAIERYRSQYSKTTAAMSLLDLVGFAGLGGLGSGGLDSYCILHILHCLPGDKVDGSRLEHLRLSMLATRKERQQSPDSDKQERFDHGGGGGK